MSLPSQTAKLALLLTLLSCITAQAPQRRGQGANTLTERRDDGGGRECDRVDCRDLTGRCTSTTDPTWGQARRAQFSYITGSSSVRATGRSRKSAREISNIVCNQEVDTVNSQRLNQLFTFFGQFLDHNLIATPPGTERFNISVPESDPDLSVGALPFTRSARGEADTPSTERPLNTLTSAIDLDAVYGPSVDKNEELLERDENGNMTGKLKTSGDNLLPLNENRFFNSPDISDRFFLAGDHRPNENPALTAIHTIFLREHNRLVDKILSKLPSRDRQEVYESARKLNIAQFQKIVYEEFYPAIIRKRLPRYRGFRANANPTVSDIFGGAAFRVGHTLVANTIPRRGASGPLPPIPMADLFERPARTFSSAEVDKVIRGTANARAQEIDAKVVDALRNMLFENVPGEEGFDLVALNLQRGRDHALPTFNGIRRIFDLSRVTSFSSISSDPETANNLATAYNDDIDEVEAFVGLISEDHVRGSGVGPTMIAVWEAEFTRLRDGDQFFYLRTDMLPDLLQKEFPECVQVLTRGRNLFRDIIVRNSGITASQLPSRNIFRA